MNQWFHPRWIGFGFIPNMAIRFAVYTGNKNRSVKKLLNLSIIGSRVTGNRD